MYPSKDDAMSKMKNRLIEIENIITDVFYEAPAEVRANTDALVLEIQSTLAARNIDAGTDEIRYIYRNMETVE
jgi:hypothetical protein